MPMNICKYLRIHFTQILFEEYEKESKIFFLNFSMREVLRMCLREALSYLAPEEEGGS